MARCTAELEAQQGRHLGVRQREGRSDELLQPVQQRSIVISEAASQQQHGQHPTATILQRGDELVLRRRHWKRGRVPNRLVEAELPAAQLRVEWCEGRRPVRHIHTEAAGAGVARSDSSERRLGGAEHLPH